MQLEISTASERSRLLHTVCKLGGWEAKNYNTAIPFLSIPLLRHQTFQADLSIHSRNISEYPLCPCNCPTSRHKGKGNVVLEFSLLQSAHLFKNISQMLWHLQPCWHRPIWVPETVNNVTTNHLPKTPEPKLPPEPLFIPRLQSPQTRYQKNRDNSNDPNPQKSLKPILNLASPTLQLPWKGRWGQPIKAEQGLKRKCWSRRRCPQSRPRAGSTGKRRA